MHKYFLRFKFLLLFFCGILASFWMWKKRQNHLSFKNKVISINYNTTPRSIPFLHSVIPKPSQLIVDTLHNLSLQNGIVIHYDKPQLREFLQDFAVDLSNLSGLAVRFVNTHNSRNLAMKSHMYFAKIPIPKRKVPAYTSSFKTIQFANSKELKVFINTLKSNTDDKVDLSQEAYSIQSIPELQQIIISGTHKGIFYATRTILQIFYQQLYHLGKVTLLPKIIVHDTPRFVYRGLHLDVARHFFPIGDLKRLIRLMSFYKLNKLHLHLSDDQGWRLEVPGFPRLTEIGSIRKRTLIGRDRGNAHKNLRFDHKVYGGFYSTNDIQELLHYAQFHQVEIIPEIDMPSHVNALIASYPFLACDSTQKYTVHELWRGAKTPLCLGRERTYKFLFNLLRSISNTFPGKYLHIGQDEVQTMAWGKCQDCQQTMHLLGIKNIDQYRRYFQQRISDYITKELKLTPIIWDDNFNPSQINPKTTLMVWKNPAHIQEAIRAKLSVIVADNNVFYLNYYQTKNYSKEPISFKRQASMRNLYAYHLPSAILGAQVLVWTEYIKDFNTLQIKLLPRMIAGAESFWTKPERKNYADFLLRLQIHNFYLNSENFKYLYLD